MVQAHLLISGFVQGVGYRRFVQKEAKKLTLKGWVTNLPDRRVEAVLQGDEDVIKTMIEICKKGPYFSEVKNISIEWQDVSEVFEDFKVVY